MSSTSVEIAEAERGDILAFDTAYLAAIDHLPVNTFIGSRVIVADSPISTKPAGIAKEITQFGGDASESNGFNCTQGKSGYRSPCTVVKGGAVQIKRCRRRPRSANPPLRQPRLGGSAEAVPEP